VAILAGIWGALIERLTALPPNAAEWEGVNDFVQEVRRLADEAARAREPAPPAEPSAAWAPAEHTAHATREYPALVIFLLDCGAAMAGILAGASRTATASGVVEKMCGTMILRSTRGSHISPRFDVILVGYSDTDFEVLPRVSIDKLADIGVPMFDVDGPSNAAAAFRRALALLQAEPPRSAWHPAPMVVHITAGEFTGDDPEPIARQIMALCTDDGAVLIENVLVADGLAPIGATAETWPGVVSEEEVNGPKLRKLLRMSSALPKQYRWSITTEIDISLREGARMLFPSSLPELAELCLPGVPYSGIWCPWIPRRAPH
jgi:hypothetical protein